MSNPIPPTQVLVRVQARGGKFLGPDIGYSTVSAVDAMTGEPLAHGQAVGDSGQITPAGTGFPEGGSPYMIMADGGARIWWLSPTQGPLLTTAGCVLKLPIAKPTLVEFRAVAARDSARTSASMWIYPGVDLLDNPGVVLVIDGLDVEIVAIKAVEGGLYVSAHVAMMCGCKISGQPNWPWPPEEFVVIASDGQNSATLTLDATTPSVYGGVLQTTASPSAISVRALQRSQSNQGFASRSMP